MVSTGNLLHAPSGPPGAERFDVLITRPGVRIERIVSTGQASPAGHWYDQDEDEFVLLLSGAAGLRIAGEADIRVLQPGDWVALPAHLRHRVEWTSGEGQTVWLAIFLANGIGG